MNLYKLSTLSGIEFINEVYNEILLRPADRNGLKYYLVLLKSGVSKSEIIINLNSSIEAQKLGNYSNSMLIEQMKKEYHDFTDNPSLLQKVKRKIKRKIIKSFLDNKVEQEINNYFKAKENKKNFDSDMEEKIQETDTFRKILPDEVYGIYVKLKGGDF